MKYMKLFESKEEDKEIIDAFKMCFQELEDKGFKFWIICGNYLQPDFSRGPILDDSSIQRFDPILKHKFLDDRINGVGISISKNGNSGAFTMGDIRSNLLFTKDYMKDEFNLNILHLEDNSLIYYKDIKYVPGGYIYSIFIFFSKY